MEQETELGSLVDMSRLHQFQIYLGKQTQNAENTGHGLMEVLHLRLECQCQNLCHSLSLCQVSGTVSDSPLCVRNLGIYWSRS